MQTKLQIMQNIGCRVKFFFNLFILLRTINRFSKWKFDKFHHLFPFYEQNSHIWMECLILFLLTLWHFYSALRVCFRLSSAFYNTFIQQLIVSCWCRREPPSPKSLPVEHIGSHHIWCSIPSKWSPIMMKNNYW